MAAPDSFSLAVLASGRGSNFQALIDASYDNSINAKITLLLTDNPNAAAIDRARKADIPAKIIERGDYPSRMAFDAALADEVEEASADLVCLAGFMRILSPDFLNRFPGKIINIHPSLLPAFPGLDVQKQALDAGVAVSGCTVHFVDEGVDTGPIIAQRQVEVKPDDTIESLSQRILEEEHRLYPEAIRMILRGEVSATAKPSAGQ